LVRWAPNIVEWGRKGWNWGAAWDTWADKALPAQ
jgi:hypothetical protein